MTRKAKVVGDITDACFEVNSADIDTVQFKTIEDTQVPASVLTRIIWPGPRATLLEHSLPKGQVLPPHRHQSEFINFLVKGQASVNMGGRRYLAEPWDSWTAVPGVEHSIEALQDCLVIDFLCPAGIVQRDCFFTWGSAQPATTHYFVKYAEAQEIPIHLVEGTDRKVGQNSVTLKILVLGPSLWLNLSPCKPGKRASHVHWHNWITYLVSGRFHVWMGGTDFDAEAGHYWGAAPGVDAANITLEESIVIEFKWPPPQAWLGRLKSWEAPVKKMNKDRKASY